MVNDAGRALRSLSRERAASTDAVFEERERTIQSRVIVLVGRDFGAPERCSASAWFW